MKLPAHQLRRQTVRSFVEREIAPNIGKWERQERIDPGLWQAAAKIGLLGLRIPTEYGGAGLDDYRFRFIVLEELARAGAASVNAGISLVDDLVGPYLVDLGTDEQKRRWLPGLWPGTTTAAIAMTEPGAGSDLHGIRTRAVRDGDEWVLNGSKTFITNGGHADLVVVVARTGERQLSLFVVEDGMPGFSRGEPLETMGRRAEAVTELFFDHVRVPAANLLGTEGKGMRHLMERMSIACFALACAESALRWTLDYTRERSAFGSRIAEFQSARFALVEMTTEIEVTRAYLEARVLDLGAGTLTDTDAAKAKWWTTELFQRVLTRCVQLHGGYGYMLAYPIARAFVDGRIQAIYGGTTEIMKEVIGRSLLA
ncbi:acyl-CoA dehydrogenase family protein [Amycolatopsis taiwanensis]|uniref:acyl-CoA dehydrogenase family protein n=1 Tax=Amycolatopsis taiwanensis TaxID=342230 RepID=UPI00316ACABF